MNRKGIVALKLATIAILILALTSCSVEHIQSDDAVVKYSATAHPLPSIISNIGLEKYNDGKVYFIETMVIDSELVTRIATINPDGTGYENLNYELNETNNSILLMDIDENGLIWLIETVALATENSNDDVYSNPVEYYITNLDNKGDVIFRSPLDLPTNLSFGVEYFCAAPDGNLYIAVDKTIYITDIELNLVSTVTTGSLGAMAVANDGKVYVLTGSLNAREIREVIANKKTLGNIMATFSHVGENLITSYTSGFDILSYDTSYLYGYDFSSGTEVKILNWQDYEMTGTKSSVSSMDANSILCCGYIPSQGDSVEWIFTTINLSEINENEEIQLTLATQSLSSELSMQIDEFNRTNDTYKISVLDYSNPSMIDKLSVELITGNGPDIIDLKSIGGDRYAANGFLEDLYKYIDTDPEITRDAYLNNIMSILEYEGSLYEVVSSFNIMTVAGRNSDLETQETWAFEDVITLQKSISAQSAFAGVTQDLLLQLYCVYAAEQFISWANGEVYFDSDGFVSLLEYCATLPSHYNENDFIDEAEAISRGLAFLHVVSVYDFLEIQTLESIFQDEIIYIGFPGETGRIGGRSYITTNISLAISSSSKNKDASWEFVRTFLTEEYQQKNSYKYGFPTNINALEHMINSAKTYNNESGNSGYNSATDIHINKIVNLMNSVDGKMYVDQNVTNIIMEEVPVFFADNRTARETANIIQSRVQLYVSEQT